MFSSLTTVKNLLAAIALLGTFAGGVVWLTEIHLTTDANADNIVELTREKEKVSTQINNIDRKLDRMEIHLEHIRDNIDHEWRIQWGTPYSHSPYSHSP